MAWRPQHRSTNFWVETLSPLRQEAREQGSVSCSSLIRALESLDGHVAAVHDVKDSDVSEDLAFLTQQLVPTLVEGPVQATLPGGEKHKAQVLLCRLISQALATRQMKIPSSAANIICTGIRQWADSGQHDPDSAQLQLEGLQALTFLLQDNLDKLADHGRASTLALLASVAHPSPTSHQGPQQLQTSVEVQRQALHALGTICTRWASLLGPDGITTILQAAVAAMQGCCTGGARTVEDLVHSRLYSTLLRTLTTAIAEGKKSWVPHTATILDCFRKFFLYGVPPAGQGTAAATPQPALSPSSQPSNSSSSSGPGNSSAGASSARRYRPPHLRAVRQDSLGDALSDSDVSDTEHVGPSNVDRFKSSKVRLAVLACLQTMCKADSRALHAHWSSVLPVQQPLQPRPLLPHLVTVLLYDPVAKVRSMAAATLCAVMEGSAQRGYLAVAEAKTMQQRATVRGFMTLSATLGQIVLSLHLGLLHAVGHEPNPAVLSIVLRALCVVAAATPYARMPPALLPEYVKVVRSRWLALQTSAALHPSEVSAIQAAYLACMAESMATKLPQPGLAQFFREGATAGQVHPLVSEMLSNCSCPQAVVRIESLAVLKGLATHYSFMMPGLWQQVCSAASFSLQETGAVDRNSPRRGSGSVPGTASGGDQQHPWGSGSRTPSASNGSNSSSWSRAGAQQSIGGSRPGGGASGNSRAGAGSEVGSASTSAEDKAAQHAVQLLGDYLASICKEHGLGVSPPQEEEGAGLPGQLASPLGAAGQQARSPSAAQQQHAAADLDPAVVTELAAMWEDATRLLIPHATQHPSYMIRSATLAIFGSLPDAVVQKLQPATRSIILNTLMRAASSDAAAAVRSAACKALGAMCLSMPWLAWDTAVAPLLLNTLRAACRDSTLSVRIAASWGLSNLCEAACSAQGQVSGGAIGAAGPVTETSCSDGVTAGPGGQLGALCTAVAELVQSGDADKVRANAVEALGNLLAFVQPSLALQQCMDLAAWLDSALASLQSCLTTGNMKVQWNSCSALGNLLHNPGLLRYEAVAVRLPSLLLLLIMLVRDSGNFKIRMHAAAALAALPDRQAYGGVYTDALLVVSAALETMASGTGAGTAAGPGVGAASISQVPAESGPDDEEGKLHNYRYVSGLVAQLKATLLHLLGLVTDQDARMVREAFSKRSESVKQMLWSQTWELLKRRCHVLGPNLPDAEHLLPADPFDLGGGEKASWSLMDLVAAVTRQVAEVEASGRPRTCTLGSQGHVDGREAVEQVRLLVEGVPAQQMNVLVQAFGGYMRLLQHQQRNQGAAAGAGGAEDLQTVQVLQEQLQQLAVKLRGMAT